MYRYDKIDKKRIKNIKNKSVYFIRYSLNLTFLKSSWNSVVNFELIENKWLCENRPRICTKPDKRILKKV